MPTFPKDAVDVVSAPGVRQAIERLSGAPEFAADVEADAMHAFRARLCFVQLATDEELFLIDTLEPEVSPGELAALFADPGRTKFFHAAGGDLQYLAEQGIRVRGLFDTHRAATLLGWQKVGLADLARERLGVELLKEHQQSDFSLRPLPPGMREYIADDVRYLCEIGRQVREECLRADILEEVLLDCERLTDEAAARPDVGAEFRPKLPRGELRGERLLLAEAMARRLHELRLRWAEAEDLPMGRVLSNAAIAALATRPPANLRELSKTPNVRGGLVREHGEELLAALEALRQQAARGELPTGSGEGREAADPAWRKRADRLKEFRGQKATERRVTPSVVLTNPLVEALAKAPPFDLEALAQVPYLGEKRVRLYGEELLRLLRS
jgi:ribonuclease D